MTRHVALAAILLTLAVAVPLAGWVLSGREAAWRRAARIESSETERERRVSAAAAQRVAAGISASLRAASRDEPAPWIAAGLRGDEVPQAWRELARAGGFVLASAERNGEPALIAVRDEDEPMGLVLDVGAIERDEGVALRPVTHAHGARLPMVEAATLRWGVHVDDPDGRADARRRAESVEREFAALLWRGVIAAVIAWGLAMTVLVQSVADARRRARLAAVAAHELRTPLASLGVHAELLADAPSLPAEHRDTAALIAAEASRLARVVTNVLDGARLERATLGVLPQRADLAASVRDEIERVLPSLRRQGVQVEVSGADAPVSATFDEEALAHVLGNLLDNAARHGGAEGARRIDVRLRPVAGHAVVEVVDHGPGLGRRSRRAGLGLGLSIARRLARQQGGSLELLPTPGGGVTARLTLPG